jgi:hypothetical protein
MKVERHLVDRAASLGGSWSKGRNSRDAYYHCQRQCRAVNVRKAVSPK